MAQTQCPNCGMYRVEARGWIFVHEQTGKTRPFGNGCLDEILFILTPIVVGAGLLLLAILSQKLIGLGVTIVGVILGFLFYKITHPKTPVGYAKYENLICSFCRKQWREKARE